MKLMTVLAEQSLLDRKQIQSDKSTVSQTADSVDVSDAAQRFFSVASRLSREGRRLQGESAIGKPTLVCCFDLNLEHNDLHQLILINFRFHQPGISGWISASAGASSFGRTGPAHSQQLQTILAPFP
jgi:hypothetical protein